VNHNIEGECRFCGLFTCGRTHQAAITQSSKRGSASAWQCAGHSAESGAGVCAHRANGSQADDNDQSQHDRILDGGRPILTDEETIELLSERLHGLFLHFDSFPPVGKRGETINLMGPLGEAAATEAAVGLLSTLGTRLVNTNPLHGSRENRNCGQEVAGQKVTQARPAGQRSNFSTCIRLARPPASGMAFSATPIVLRLRLSCPASTIKRRSIFPVVKSKERT